MSQLGQIENDVAAGFREAMRRFPATVSIITAHDDIRDQGMTVTALTSVSMDPPSLMVCLNNRTLLHEMLLERPNFAVNVLHSTQTVLSDAFSGRVPPEERFEGDAWVRDTHGMLVLKEAHANIVCRRKVAVPYGTHTMFVGEVISAKANDVTLPLSYLDARYCVSQPH